MFLLGFQVYFLMQRFVHGDLEKFSLGLCLKEEYDLFFEDSSYLQCVEKCRSKKSCFGISVNTKANICRLHVQLEGPGTPEKCVGYVYSKKKNWTQKTIEGCKDTDCGEQETCTLNASGGTVCKNEECHPIEDIMYGKVYGSNNLKVGSKVLYKCDRQENNLNNDVIRTCQPNGKWNGVIPVCPLPECKMLYDIQNGIVQGIEHRTIGSEVSYVCKSQYKVKRGDEKRRCLDNLSWSGIQPTCLQYEFVLPWYNLHPTYTEFDMYANDISFVNTNRMAFKVKANSNVHILLHIYRNNFASFNTFEIVLGGWSNTKSSLRHGNVDLVTYEEMEIVNPNTFSNFWIFSSYNCIAVGKGLVYNRSAMFLKYCEVTTKFKYLSIGVGHNSGATFIFP